MRTFSRARVDGDSLVVTIPIDWVRYLGLEEGDVIDWEVHSVPEDFDAAKKGAKN